MDDLKFDIYAMTKPKSREDLIVLLDEAIAEMEYINEQLESLLNSTCPFPKNPSAR